MKIGDVVQVISGGPLMTVAGVSNNPNIVQVAWFDGGELNTGSFRGVELRIWRLEEVEPNISVDYK